ncbi:MAG: hypothetical protein JJE04_15700 [Acidobacteriia bacterium]|nr:hypothetical protein [Terriglobia bacterium]
MPARLIGAAGVGTAASPGALGRAISDSRVTVPDSTRVAQWVAITQGVTIGGYVIGRAMMPTTSTALEPVSAS